MAKKKPKPKVAPAPTLRYTKPAQSCADLLAHLKSRGLEITNVPEATEALERISYYRLLIYCRALQDNTTKHFVAGATFKDLLDLYNFDRKLRLLCLDAIERIEVALRAAINNSICVAHGPHFYLDRAHFSSSEGYRDFMQRAMRPRYLGVQHYQEKYIDPGLPPFWAVAEGITFGDLSKLYSCLISIHQKSIAKQFNGYDYERLKSWFKALNYLRNICAHHNRLWNFSMLVDRPQESKALPELTNNHKFYARAVLLVALLAIVEPGNGWRNRLIKLIDEYPNVPTGEMGFPAGWRALPFWT
ncbi:Abi family protein [Azospirillum argentinense]